MRIFPYRDLSDEEYVESIRKRARFMRGIQWLWPVFTCLLFVALIGIGRRLPSVISNFPEQKSVVTTGLVIGLILGMILGYGLFQTALFVQRWIKYRKGDRSEMLLLKYHDELQKR